MTNSKIVSSNLRGNFTGPNFPHSGKSGINSKKVRLCHDGHNDGAIRSKGSGTIYAETGPTEHPLHSDP